MKLLAVFSPLNCMLLMLLLLLRNSMLLLCLETILWSSIIDDGSKIIVFEWCEWRNKGNHFIANIIFMINDWKITINWTHAAKYIIRVYFNVIDIHNNLCMNAERWMLNAVWSLVLWSSTFILDLAWCAPFAAPANCSMQFIHIKIESKKQTKLQR